MAANKIKNGVYFIQNLVTGTVIDLKDGSRADGTKTQGYTKRELSDPLVPHQLWIISHIEPDTYTIENVMGRTLLTLMKAEDRTPVEGVRALTELSERQKWEISRANNGTAYIIRNKSTGTYIDLFTGTVNGTAINGWAGNGVGTTNAHQLWHIVRA